MNSNTGKLSNNINCNNNYSDSGLEILKEEKFTYSSHVTFNSKSLQEIPFYTREFTTTKIYKLCQIDINIPMTGNDSSGSRNRLLLYLDDEVIFDASFHDPTNWVLKPLAISAKKVNLLQGFHKIKLVGCVDRGTCYIPHFDSGCIESTIYPPISGRLYVFGYN